MTERKTDGFFQVGGALDQDAPSYVTRLADSELIQAVLSGEYCNVLTARQTGKSSLMVRTVSQLRSQGVRTVVIDLTAIGIEVSQSQWYFGLISQFKRQLDLKLNEVAWWSRQSHLGSLQRFSNFLREVVLEEVQEPIVAFVDEIDSTLNLPFTDDFFAVIRAAYNNRAGDPAYSRLTFVLLGVARPSDLIKARTRTPYNIGSTIDLRDFAAEDTQLFQTGLETAHPKQAEKILERVLYWTDGHPYLTQKVCAEVVADDGYWSSERIDALVERLFLAEEARSETNLQSIRDRIRESRERAGMLRLYRKLRTGKQVIDEEREPIKSQLKLTGLIKATPNGELMVRNRIYAHVFDLKWVKEAMPVSPRQRVAIFAIVIAILAILSMGYLFYRQQSRPAEVKAELFTSTFLTATSPDVRLNNLASLIELKGYEEQARDLFFETDADQQLGIFGGLSSPQQVGQDVLSVVEEVYQDQRLQNNTEHNQLLRTMAQILHEVEGNDVPGAKAVAMELDYWLAGREQAAKGEFEAAGAQYDLALGLKEDNPAVLFDRALAQAALGKYDRALVDLQAVANLDEEREEGVRKAINQDAELFTFLGVHRSDFPIIAAWFPTLTPTLTSTPTFAPTPTGTPTSTPTSTFTPTPTSTPTSTPTNTPTPTPTFTPTPTPQKVEVPVEVGELIFWDDFGTVTGSWRERNDPDIITRIDSGERVMQVRRPATTEIGNYVWPDLVQGKSEKDLILQVTAYIPADSSARGYGLVFGWQTASEGSDYYFDFNLRRIPEGRFAAFHKTFVDYSTQVRLIPLPGDITENEQFAHTLTLVMSGNTAQGYVDGVFVGEHVFEEYSGGPFGIMTVVTSTEQMDSVRFDNFRSWRLP